MKITVEYKDNIFNYEHGYHVYILDYAIYHEIDKKYGIDGLKAFVYRVGECYLKDSNHTPLGAITDYMAKNWKKLKNKSRYDILDKFYMQLD